MKALIPLILLATICFTSCKSDETKIKDSIEKYFNENMDDPSKYEAVSYGEIEYCSSCKSLDSIPYNKSVLFTYRRILTNLESGVQLKRLVKVYIYLDSKLNIVSVVDSQNKRIYNINSFPRGI